MDYAFVRPAPLQRRGLSCLVSDRIACDTPQHDCVVMLLINDRPLTGHPLLKLILNVDAIDPRMTVFGENSVSSCIFLRPNLKHFVGDV